MRRQPKEQPGQEPGGWGFALGALALGAALVGAYAFSSSTAEEEPAYSTQHTDPVAPNYPSEVLFTQKSITARVNHQGRQDPLVNLVRDVLAGDYVKPIRIAYDEGRWKSIDNHRLFAFQLYQSFNGKAPQQPWFQVVEKTEEFFNKDQTEDGRVVSVAGRISWDIQSSVREGVLRELSNF
jgi:hypothetical protein